MAYIVAHWDVISSVLLFVISEAMGANPNWKYNGILDAIRGLLKKQNQQIPPAQ